MNTVNTPTVCRTCGAPINPRRGKAGRIPGVLERGSFVSRVVDHLHETDAELTAEDISVRFDDGRVKPRDVCKRLSTALRFGYIESVITPRGVRVFRKAPGNKA